MSRLDAILLERTAQRRDLANAAAAQLIAEAKALGCQVSLVGSLARGTFASHSDIDLVVHGPIISPEQRASLERLTAGCLRASGLPYDLIYEADIGPDRTQELLHDVSPSGIR